MEQDLNSKVSTFLYNYTQYYGCIEELRFCRIIDNSRHIWCPETSQHLQRCLCLSEVFRLVQLCLKVPRCPEVPRHVQRCLCLSEVFRLVQSCLEVPRCPELPRHVQRCLCLSEVFRLVQWCLEVPRYPEVP